MARGSTESANIPWTDDELRQSVEVYVLLLRLQLLGSKDRSEPLAQALLGGALAQRNDAAIRYRLRNVSAVANELGAPILTDFSPAESVGKLVRPRIRAMLLEDPDFARLLSPAASPTEDDRQTALTALKLLRRQIEDLESQLKWRGHNGPPDQVDIGVDGADLRTALEDINLVEKQLESPTVDKEAIAGSTSRILGLGLKLAKWLGERTTKFVDAALVAAAPIAVAQVTGLLPTIVNAVEAIGRAMAH